MVTETKPETELTLEAPVPADSTLSPPDSSPAPAELSATEATPAEDGSPAPEQAEKPEPARPVSQLSPQEQEAELDALESKGKEKGLSAEELTRQRSLSQAVTDRREQYDRWVRSLEDDHAKLVNDLATRTNQQWTEIAGTFDFIKNAWDENRPIDFDTLGKLNQTNLSNFLGSLKEATTQVELRDLRKFALETLGDTPKNRETLYAYKDPVQLAKDIVGVYRNRLSEIGKGDAVVMSKAELEKAKKDAGKEAVDKFRSENPGYVSPQVAGNGSLSTAGKLYSEMTPEEKANFSSAERDRLVAEEIRVRTSRR